MSVTRFKQDEEQEMRTVIVMNSAEEEVEQLRIGMHRVNIGPHLENNDAFYEYVTFIRQGWRCEFFTRTCAVCDGVIGAYEMYGELQIEGTRSGEITGAVSVCYHRVCKSNLHDYVTSTRLFDLFDRVALVHLMRARVACVWDKEKHTYFLLKKELPSLMEARTKKK